MKDSLTTIHNTCLDLLAKGDEQGARQLLVEEFANLPEDVQQAVAFEFFNESLEALSEEGTSVQNTKLQMLQILSQLEKELPQNTSLEVPPQTPVPPPTTQESALSQPVTASPPPTPTQEQPMAPTETPPVANTLEELAAPTPPPPIPTSKPNGQADEEFPPMGSL